MIPVPRNVIAVKQIGNEPSHKHRRLLNYELQFCRRNTQAIFRTAKYVYNTIIERKDSVIVKSCCDFKILENALELYHSEQEIKNSQPEQNTESEQIQ